MIPLRLDYLSAALIIAPKNDPRQTINGVLIEYGRNGAVFTVATNGTMLLILRDASTMSAQITEPGHCIIPRDVVQTFIQSARQNRAELRPPQPGQRGASLQQQGARSPIFVPLEGDFPNWREAVPPREASGSAAQFEARHLADLSKIGEVLRESSSEDILHPFIAHNGPTAHARVTWPGLPDVLGVIRPLRAALGQQAVDWI